jgi:short-subunit dehydrogenase
MRQRKSGVIINVASVGGRMTFPFYSVYHATKWAVEGFTESLAYELREHGIRVKIIEPGPSPPSSTAGARQGHRPMRWASMGARSPGHING